MKCNELQNNICMIASGLAGCDVMPVLSQCEYCTKQADPSQSINKVTVSLAVAQAKDALAKKQIVKSYGDFLTKVERPTQGPGTELKKIIEWFPIPQAKKKNCGRCKSLELRMNKWGCDVCDTTKRPFIIAKLMIAAKRAKIPTTEFALGILLNRAIYNARNV